MQWVGGGVGKEERWGLGSELAKSGYHSIAPVKQHILNLC